MSDDIRGDVVSAIVSWKRGLLPRDDAHAGQMWHLINGATEAELLAAMRALLASGR